MKGLHMVAWILLIIGGLDWGLVAFGWGLDRILPGGLMTIIYILVGLSALYELFTHKKNCKMCSTDKPMAGGMGQM
jgi:uncharacterized membrane protein YuzA (DUF378 family)